MQIKISYMQFLFRNKSLTVHYRYCEKYCIWHQVSLCWLIFDISIALCVITFWSFLYWCVMTVIISLFFVFLSPFHSLFLLLFLPQSYCLFGFFMLSLCFFSRTLHSWFWKADLVFNSGMSPQNPVCSLSAVDVPAVYCFIVFLNTQRYKLSKLPKFDKVGKVD